MKEENKLEGFGVWEKYNSMDDRLLEAEKEGEKKTNKMVQELPEKQNGFDVGRFCPFHKEKIEGICLSPYCNHYRQMCARCLEGHAHVTEYRGWEQALQQAKKLLKCGLDQLQLTRVRKNADVENYLRNNMVLLQIQNSLKQIEQLILQKIEGFRRSVNRIYYQHVRQKLEDLDDIIAKNYKTLQNELKALNLKPGQSLSSIFRRDLLHEVKYYDSYFNEIFIKKTRNFRTALQNDRILTLIVNFQQNLQRIFTFNVEKAGTDHRQFHFFRQEQDSTVLYEMGMNYQSIEKKDLKQDVTQLVSVPEKYQYTWQGIPSSIFYPLNNCYYIIGEGKKVSRQIVKYQLGRPLEDAFYALRSMETERRQFAVCELGGEIYIVGGENDKDGCLSRCEKFVPQYSSQIYIIHSLNVRSSRHSLTTYKNKFILKFGGIKQLRPASQHLNTVEDITAPPEIYSIDSQEWSVINISREFELKFGICPSIFRIQNKNMLLVLGGGLSSERVTISIIIEQGKDKLQQLRMRTHKSRLGNDNLIYNSTIRVDEEQNACSFMNSADLLSPVALSQLKLYNWYS